jgi:hypothetical protein
MEHPDAYPNPGEFTYQEYLNSISPALGTQLEYIRTLTSSIDHVVRDMNTLAELAATDRPRQVSSVCMSTLMTTSEHHNPINKWHTLQRIITHHLNIPMTREMEDALVDYFYSSDFVTTHLKHSTKRSELRHIHPVRRSSRF